MTKNPVKKKKLRRCSTDVGEGGLNSPNSQSTPPNLSSSLPDKVIFQLIAYYYETLPQTSLKLVDHALDLLLSRPAKNSENQLI